MVESAGGAPRRRTPEMSDPRRRNLVGSTGDEAVRRDP
ncbi:hypothetical protein Rhow_004610 [Rhodococcus wratislaviensis]|uniref:Uncharacterized protein n=1 Tax=Rhodococcus wratislaviensis TaxID=44752 RepID=A0A402CBV4_RHOWR|nr:hypothetical protein Rhow_004610 [Rhodococcus wratislaviensis]